MYNLGLIGKPLKHSFSKNYFDNKFQKYKIQNFSYTSYCIESLQKINKLIQSNNLIGLNVTRPYKTQIIEYLDYIDEVVQETNSTNTIFINPNNKKKIGFNTDLIGFESTLKKCKLKRDTKALILGSGSVSKTISYAFRKQNIEHVIVSRTPLKGMIKYTDVKYKIHDYKLIVNTTPVGQYPQINKYPNIPYDLITSEHNCIDLIYNPKTSLFLKKCAMKKAHIINGEHMLLKQAEASWEIWQQMIKKNV